MRRHTMIAVIITRTELDNIDLTKHLFEKLPASYYVIVYRIWVSKHYCSLYLFAAILIHMALMSKRKIIYNYTTITSMFAYNVCIYNLFFFFISQ